MERQKQRILKSHEQTSGLGTVCIGNYPKKEFEFNFLHGYCICVKTNFCSKHSFLGFEPKSNVLIWQGSQYSCTVHKSSLGIAFYFFAQTSTLDKLAPCQWGSHSAHELALPSPY